MLSIYDKNGKHKATLNYIINEFKPSWYPEWEEGDLISATKLNNPIIDNGQIREMTREELVKAGIDVTLNDGEYIEDAEIKTVEIPSHLIRAVWDSKNHLWKEGYTKEEYFKDIDNVKADILAGGYTWREHRQKCRDKDIGLMTATIESLRDYQDVYKQEMAITWYFEDNDGAKVKLKDMQELRLTGLNFVQKVYDVENKLKTSNIQKITKEKYLDLLKM